MSKRRFPDYLVMQINSTIRAAAYKLRAEKKAAKEDPAFSNSEIVESIKVEVHKLFSHHYLQLTEHYLSTQVSLVLEGRSAERRITTMILPGLDLAEWLAVPNPQDADGWKVPLDCTPNELKRIEDRRTERIRQEQTENEKIRVVRTTAEAKGCDPDEPISTVFDDDRPGGPPTRPEDRPRP